VSSVITIGFAGRTRACIRTEFTPPIADDERRETLIHVALLTARTFAALDAPTQLTFAATLREWIEDQFIACPTRLIPGDPMACLPRFASTFVAPVREYALASKGCDQNGRGIEFFLPMALVSFLHHVVVTHPDPEDLLKPALALCGAVVIQPMTMENHFQAAGASLPKVVSLTEKTPPEVILTAVSLPAPIPPPIPTIAKRPIPGIPARDKRPGRRRTLIISACVAALMIIAGVQYLSVSPTVEFAPREMVARRPPVTVPPPPLASIPSPEAPVPMEAEPSRALDPLRTLPPEAVVSPTPAPPSSSSPTAAVDSVPVPSVPTGPAPVAEEPAEKSSSRSIRVYQRQVRDLGEDAMAQVAVIVNAIDGQVLTEFALNDVLAYGLRMTKADLKQLQRLVPPERYQEKQDGIIQVVAELQRLAQELSVVQVQPPAGVLQSRLSGIEARLEKALSAVDN
jgi:hypothetical protein